MKPPSLIWLAFCVLLASLPSGVICGAPVIPGVAWAAKGGGSGDDTVTAVAFGPNGNCYVTGYFQGTATFGSTVLTSQGATDIFVAAYSNTGQLLWVTQAGGSTGDQGQGIATDANGNIYVTGYFEGTASFGSFNLTGCPYGAVFVAKLNSSGQFVWVQQTTAGFGSFGESCAMDNNGNLYVIGQFFGQTQFWDGFSQSGFGIYSMFLLKMTTDGHMVWLQNIRNSQNGPSETLAVDGNGNCYTAGYTGSPASKHSSASNTLFVQKFDTSGNELWETDTNTPTAPLLQSIVPDGSGGVYLATSLSGSATFGSITVTSSGGEDGLLGHYDSTGTPAWFETFGGPSDDEFHGLAMDNNGNLVATGFFQNTASFGAQTLTSEGGKDIVIANFKPDGTPISAYNLGGTGDDSIDCVACAANGNFVLGGSVSNSFYAAGVLMASSGGTDALVLYGGTADTDHDGIPDAWEIVHGLNPNDPTDAGTHPPGDKLTYRQKYVYGLNPLTTDTDGDTLTDYDELFVYGTDPLKPDTDGDGMPDGWEVAHGLNPRVNDANGDADFDGLTNLEEYLAGTDPQSAFTNGSTVSDYQRVKGGMKRTLVYDANNRLVGELNSNGTSFGFAYDGNGNITRQTLAVSDADHDGLPDAWEIAYGLNPNSAVGDDGPWGDPDHDGWTNHQEWLAGTNPKDPNSHPSMSSPTVSIFETPTLAQIIPAISTLGALPTLTTRLWDNEGNSAQVVVQYFDPTTQQWKNATLTTLDGATYNSANTVAALPTGTSHSVVWNAYADLGSTFNGTVQLRVQGNDPFLAGAWSTPLTVSVNMNTATNSGVPDAWAMQHGLNINGPSFAATDADHDGLSDLLEYAFNTDPSQPNASPITNGLDAGKHLTVTYTRRTDAPQLTYVVEVSHDMMTWSSGTQYTVELSAVDQGNNTELVITRSVDTTSSTSQLFMRVRVNVSGP